jgi:hypothetical protein
MRFVFYFTSLSPDYCPFLISLFGLTLIAFIFLLSLIVSSVLFHKLPSLLFLNRLLSFFFRFMSLLTRVIHPPHHCLSKVRSNARGPYLHSIDCSAIRRHCLTVSTFPFSGSQLLPQAAVFIYRQDSCNRLTDGAALRAVRLPFTPPQEDS